MALSTLLPIQSHRHRPRVVRCLIIAPHAGRRFAMSVPVRAASVAATSHPSRRGLIAAAALAAGALAARAAPP